MLSEKNWDSDILVIFDVSIPSFKIQFNIKSVVTKLIVYFSYVSTQNASPTMG